MLWWFMQNINLLYCWMAVTLKFSGSRFLQMTEWLETPMLWVVASELLANHQISFSSFSDCLLWVILRGLKGYLLFHEKEKHKLRKVMKINMISMISFLIPSPLKFLLGHYGGSRHLGLETLSENKTSTDSSPLFHPNPHYHYIVLCLQI